MRTAVILFTLSILATMCLAQATPSICPIADFQGTCAEFGPRTHPVPGSHHDHKGIDFFVPVGTPILATGDGKVTQARSVEKYGVVVRIQHGHGVQTFYAHLADFTISVGQAVHKGEVIGHSGNSGVSSGPHLHYEVIKNGTAKNPRDYIAQR
jgi:murein DD-endopeptidase MepM/ murein hydrolase activator NlpD